MDETTRSELGESRWPMASAVVAVIVLTYLLPAQVRVVSFGSVRVAPILEAVLLVALIIGDPGVSTGAQQRCSGWRRRWW